MGACRMLFSARWWNKSPHTHDSSLRSLKRKKYVNYLSFSFATQPRVWAIAIRPLSRAINIFSRSFAAFLCRLCTHVFFSFAKKDENHAGRGWVAEKRKREAKKKNWWEKRGHLKVPFDTQESSQNNVDDKLSRKNELAEKNFSEKKPRFS